MKFKFMLILQAAFAAVVLYLVIITVGEVRENGLKHVIDELWNGKTSSVVTSEEQ